MANIAVMGYGTIGSGVYEVIEKNADIIAKKAGEKLNIKYVLDLRDFPGQPVEKVLTHNADDIINDESVDVVIEVMGGVEPAFTFVKKALEAGKSVVTSNKALVEAKGAELIKLARQKNLNFFFEASVGGAIPIIRPLVQCLTADKILEIKGILNGTTNYILTEMAEKGADFDVALKQAQDLGYAEKDPTADVEGHDPCRKIAILSSLAFDKTAKFEDIYTEGITKITADDMEYAKKLGGVIKLVASSRNTDKGISAMVAPMLLSKDHPLATVNGVFNAIFVKGNVIGDVMFFGSGAGSLPTASAVVSDAIDAVKHKGENVYENGWSEQKLEILAKDDVEVKALIRIKGDKADAQRLFPNCETAEIKSGEIGVIAEGFTEGSLSEKLENIGKETDTLGVLRMDM